MHRSPAGGVRIRPPALPRCGAGAKAAFGADGPGPAAAATALCRDLPGQPVPGLNHPLPRWGLVRRRRGSQPNRGGPPAASRAGPEHCLCQQHPACFLRDAELSVCLSAVTSDNPTIQR